jgi:hypothetical protein
MAETMETSLQQVEEQAAQAVAAVATEPDVVEAQAQQAVAAGL